MAAEAVLHGVQHREARAPWIRDIGVGDAVTRLFVLACLLTISLCEANAQNYTISVDGEQFTKRFVGKPPGGDKLIEYVREAESFEKWTKLIGFRYQQLPRIQNDPIKFVSTVAQLVKASNPDAQARIIINDEKEEALLDFVTWPPDGSYIEFNVFRYARSTDGNAVVSLQLAYPSQTDRPKKSISLSDCVSLGSIRRLHSTWRSSMLKLHNSCRRHNPAL
ncbi:MAG: hypothetical protein KIS79_03875 [Burkholderiales bacterium]|nr:hypothetical protein [Burkholderiales bacterium]